MKKVIYGTLFLGLIGLGIVGCKKDSLKSSVNNQLDKPIYNNEDIFKDLRKSSNPYSRQGEDFYFDLITIKENVFNTTITEDEIAKFIDICEWNREFELAEYESDYYDTYFSDKIFNTKTIIEFESEIIKDSLIPQLAKQNLLESVAYLKWSFYFFETESPIIGEKLSGKPLAEFESCVDSCMRKKLSEIFNDGNWIDKLQFIIGAAPNTAWMVASCSWECR